MKKYVFLAFLAATVLTLPAIALELGEVEASRVEAPASGETLGSLRALFIDRFTEDSPVALPGFHLTSPDAHVTAHRAAVTTGNLGFDAGTTEDPRHDGALVAVGVETRPDYHLWITNLDATEAAVRVVHDSCTNLQEPATSEERRNPSVNQERAQVAATTTGSVHLASCTDAVLHIEGDLTLTVWDWSVTLNGDRTDTGVNDTTGPANAGLGSATELVIEARDAVLSVPLTPKTYALYLTNPDLVTQTVRFHDAEGTLPGLTEPVEGVDVELVGDYWATLTPTGTGLSATVSGTTRAASIDGEPLNLEVPAPPSMENAPSLVLGVVVVLAVLVVGLVLLVAWPRLRGHHERVVAVPEQDTAPRPAQQRGRDVEAMRLILRVVRRNPGITGRRLQERARAKGVSKERCLAAVQVLLERGDLVRQGSDARWHFFHACSGLDGVWEQVAALQDPNLRLLYDLVRELSTAEQRIVVAVASQRWNWPATTTKARLRRLAAVGLVRVTKSGPVTRSGPNGTLFVTPAPAPPTGVN